MISDENPQADLARLGMFEPLGGAVADRDIDRAAVDGDRIGLGGSESLGARHEIVGKCQEFIIHPIKSINHQARQDQQAKILVGAKQREASLGIIYVEPAHLP